MSCLGMSLQLSSTLFYSQHLGHHHSLHKETSLIKAGTSFCLWILTEISLDSSRLLTQIYELKSGWLPPYLSCHRCTGEPILPSWLVLWLRVLTTGQSDGCFISPSSVCRSFWLDPSLLSLYLAAEVQGICCHKECWLEGQFFLIFIMIISSFTADCVLSVLHLPQNLNNS